jgi:hypothetical protein
MASQALKGLVKEIPVSFSVVKRSRELWYGLWYGCRGGTEGDDFVVGSRGWEIGPAGPYPVVEVPLEGKVDN